MQARLQAEQAVLSKLDRIRIDQTSRADALEREAQEAEAKVWDALFCAISSAGPSNASFFHADSQSMAWLL